MHEITTDRNLPGDEIERKRKHERRSSFKSF